MMHMQGQKPGGVDACEPFRTGVVGMLEQVLQGRGWGPLWVLLVGLLAAIATWVKCRSLPHRPRSLSTSGPKLL